MTDETNLVALLHNAALLLAMVVAVDLAAGRQPTGGRRARQGLVGAVLGLIGIGIMLAPLRLEPGIVFDTRSVLLAVSGLFLGPVPTVVAMVLMASFRLVQGGTAAWTGAAVVLASGGIGIAWRRRRAPLEDASWRELYGLGLVVHVVMLALMLTLPGEAAWRVLAGIGLPVLLVYPLATAGLGVVLAARLRRERAARALAESEEQFRAMFEVASIGMAQADVRTGQWLRVNGRLCQITGYSADEMLGLRLSEITHPEDRERDWQAFGRVVRGEAADYRLEKRYLRKDGGVVWVNVNMTVVRDANGEAVRTMATIEDVTERRQAEDTSRRLLGELTASRKALLSVVEDQKRAQAEVRRLNAELEARVRDRTAALEAANKELEAFSYSVSHDLRAPLRAINGYAAILTEDYGPGLDAEGRRVLGVVRAEALRMGKLIDDLLRFSRLGRQPLRRVATDVTALVREVQTDLRARAPDRAVDFRLDPLPQAPADAVLLRQVWFNLLDNAWKYTRRRERAEIVVTGWTEGAEAVFSVKDNGAGFEMKYASKLFGVFQRLHRAEEFEGTGVGLALVQRLVQRHGGRVWAEGEPDRGATFSFTLPLSVATSGMSAE